MAMTFAEIVAIAHDEGYGVAGRGIDLTFDLFEHLYRGGTLYNFDKAGGEYMVALIAAVWLDIKRAVDERVSSDED